jgi:molybdopterin-guanine dinucleotide biosynthesis protein A
MSTFSVTAVLLCGGCGERLGGVDKPLRVLAGRPLIEHVIARIASQVDAIVISANRNADVYARYGYAVVDDGMPTGRGPLAGIAAGLAAAGSDDVLCVPGDAPLLPADLEARLDAARRAAHGEAAVVDDGRGLQPLCTLLPRTALAGLHAFLDGGGRAAHRWLESLPAARADFSAWPRWAWSVNTEAEWIAAERNLNGMEIP